VARCWTEFHHLGGLHGFYLIAAYLWHIAKETWALPSAGAPGRIVARTVTFLAVVMAWVFFRVSNLGDAFSMLSSMIGLHGISLPVHTPERLQEMLHSLFGDAVAFSGVAPNVALPSIFLLHPVMSAVSLCAALTFVVMALPNTQQIMRLLRPALYDRSAQVTGAARIMIWRPSLLHVGAIVALGLCAMTRIENVQPFIYFRF
jgi:alginate O-acetyltransferase complex protein AlgI